MKIININALVIVISLTLTTITSSWSIPHSFRFPPGSNPEGLNGTSGNTTHTHLHPEDPDSNHTTHHRNHTLSPRQVVVIPVDPKTGHPLTNEPEPAHNNTTTSSPVQMATVTATATRLPNTGDVPASNHTIIGSPPPFSGTHGHPRFNHTEPFCNPPFSNHTDLNSTTAFHDTGFNQTGTFNHSAVSINGSALAFGHHYYTR